MRRPTHDVTRVLYVVRAHFALNWLDKPDPEDVKTAAGASLGLESAVGFALPLSAELTVARGFDDQGDTKVYFRFGLAF